MTPAASEFQLCMAIAGISDPQETGMNLLKKSIILPKMR